MTDTISCMPARRTDAPKYVAPPVKRVNRAEFETLESRGHAFAVPFGPAHPMVYGYRDTFADWDGRYWAFYLTDYRVSTYGPINVVADAPIGPRIPFPAGYTFPSKD